MTTDRPAVAVFRPDDERLEDAIERLEELGARPVPDPMLSVEPTGATPEGASVVVLTSTTGVSLVEEAGWDPGGATVAAIGPATASALEAAGYPVDVVPAEYTSSGLVATLEEEVDLAGTSVEVARSDHGSDVLLDGLAAAGADVTETVLYRLRRPADAGRSVEMAASGDLDAALFTSSLTVVHFLETATDVDRTDEVHEGLEAAVVGVIGEPTSQTAVEHDVSVDVVASEATFDALARETLEKLP